MYVCGSTFCWWLRWNLRIGCPSHDLWTFVSLLHSSRQTRAIHTDKHIHTYTHTLTYSECACSVRKWMKIVTSPWKCLESLRSLEGRPTQPDGQMRWRAQYPDRYAAYSSMNAYEYMYVGMYVCKWIRPAQTLAASCYRRHCCAPLHCVSCTTLPCWTQAPAYIHT